MLWICALAALLNTLAFGLTDLDEGFYASVAREMLHNGDYLTPRLGGEPWFEKPPLLYWLMVLSMRIFGPSEFAVRLPSVLAYWLTLGMLATWGNRRLGEGVGTRAALIFALAPLSLILSRLAITDMLLTCWLTLGLIALWEMCRKPAWSLVLGLAMGLAVLTKGPVGLGLIGLQALLSLSLLRKEGVRLRWGWLALVVALLAPTPWYVGVYMQHGKEFFQEFFIKQNLLRFSGEDAAHAVRNPILYPLYYVVVLWLGLFPFSMFVPNVAFGSGTPVQAYLRRWSWLVFALFTLGITKLPAYIFPMFPAVALLIASWKRMGEWRNGRRGKEGMEVWKCGSVGDNTKNLKLQTSNDKRPLLQWFVYTLGSVVWIGVSGTLALYSHSALPVLLGIGSAVMGATFFPSTRLRWVFMSALALLIGLHFSLRVYDSFFLKPVRDLALSVPREQPLVLHRIHPGLPSLGFYRDGAIIKTDSKTVVRKIFEQEGYCLTTSDTLPPGHWEVVRKAEVGGRLFVPLRLFVLLKGQRSFNP